MKHLKDWRIFHNKESSLPVLTENDRPTPSRTRCTFQNVNQPFCGDARLSHSPAARKALPFTFKQQNNNQWSIINAEIILCCYPAECKDAGVGQPVLWIALSPLHGDAAMISVVFFRCIYPKFMRKLLKLGGLNHPETLFLALIINY